MKTTRVSFSKLGTYDIPCKDVSEALALVKRNDGKADSFGAWVTEKQPYGPAIKWRAADWFDSSGEFLGRIVEIA